jgi:outer membrane protein OmpA-like peptidoglycan-associated protein
MTRLRFLACIALGCGCALAQTAAPQSDASQQSNSVPIYRVTVIARTTKAINYNHRSGSTKVDMVGTTLLPEGRGTAEVASKQGAIHVDAELKHLQPASQFGPEYVTYVLWAISPEGRPVNLGDVLLNGDGNSKFSVTSNLQAFGLIVTAEPYFAVTMPSDVVVMENEVGKDTVGTIEQVDAKYELLQRGQYETNVNPAELQPMVVNKKTPIELHEARNAVRIAKWTGAEKYAAESLQKAETDLQNAEGYESSGHDKKAEITSAREAVQMAEDARLITLKKMDAERQATEQQASADAAAQAEAQADVAIQQKQQADAEAEKAKADAAAAQAAAQQAQQTADRAETDKASMRAQLAKQLNAILETRDSARGLIVNMSDVLFDTGKFSLKPGAREKLAKVAGILLAYPGLTIEVDGHTDNVGGDEFNQTLSEQRAGAVRDYLVQQGVSANAVSAKGFGKTQPVASNDNSAGRQMNRRVELVVAGDLIGNTASAAPIDQSR